tara:strand:- start:766 stop:1017 length:252 start_codon:yes stop_codon:yes gene_type:complete
MDELTINLQENEEMSDRFSDLSVGDELTATVTLKVNTSDSEMIKFDVVDLEPDSAVSAETSEGTPDTEQGAPEEINAVTSLFN